MTAREVLTATAVFVAFVVAAKGVSLLLRRIAPKITGRTKTELDDEILRIATRPAFILVILAGLYYSLALLPALKPYSLAVWRVIAVAATLVAVVPVVRTLNVLATWYAKRGASDAEIAVRRQFMVTVRKLLTALVYLAALFVILDITGVDIKPLIASLGIGGLVAAVALQNVLADLLCSLSIYLDRPFQVGDFVVVGQHKGTVEKVGIYSTRIRALQGEQIVISNRELRNTRIQNFKKMRRRRAAFTFGVRYETPLGKLREIPSMVEQIINRIEIASLDRAHFTKFGDYSLVFEVVYFLDTSDYKTYMDVQQQINFEIMERFEREGIQMAYPTQTLLIEQAAQPGPEAAC